METIIARPKSKGALIKKMLSRPVSALRSLAKDNLFFFLKSFWHLYSEQEFKPNWHIEYICNELEIIARRVAANLPKEYDLIINIPPGSTKTAVVLIMFPIWCWVNWYWMRFITASYTSPLSLESAVYSRDIMRSDKWSLLFPDITIRQDQDMKSNFRCEKREIVNGEEEIKKGGNRFSTSVGGSIMGFHGHINLIDDPLDPLGAISEAKVTEANYWFDNTLPFRKVDKKVTPTILIMQRLHQNDPTGHLLKEKGDKIKHICLPGEIKNYREKVSPPELVDKYVDNLLDPVRLDWQVLNDLLLLGQYTYGGQVGQDPVPLGGGMFHVDHLQIIDRVPHFTEIEKTVRYWDKAGTEGGGAFTVGVKMCRLKSKKFVILDVKRGQWASDKREQIMKECAEADGVQCKIGIEQEPGSGGLESADATIKNLAGFSVYKDRPTGDKAYRADPFSVQVNLGEVQMVLAPWNSGFIDELRNFPNSTYKDQTDAGSGAFSKLLALKRVKVGRGRR